MNIIVTVSAHSPNVATGAVAGGATASGGATAAAPKATSVSDLAHTANVMTAWTDKLYTENMGCIFTSPPPPAAGGSGGGLMNNGRQDTSPADVQKLQQQLQDIKDQVRCCVVVGRWLEAPSAAIGFACVDRCLSTKATFCFTCEHYVVCKM